MVQLHVISVLCSYFKYVHSFLIAPFSLDPGTWYVEQLVEYAVGHHPLPRDLRRRRTKYQKTVKALALLPCTLCLQILLTCIFLHLLEGNRNRSPIHFLSLKSPCRSMMRVSLCYWWCSSTCGWPGTHTPSTQMRRSLISNSALLLGVSLLNQEWKCHKIKDQ